MIDSFGKFTINKEEGFPEITSPKIAENEFSVGLPDPSWDYAAIWEALQNAKEEIEGLLEALAQLENATHQADAEIIISASAVKDMMDKISKIAERSSYKPGGDRFD